MELGLQVVLCWCALAMPSLASLHSQASFLQENCSGTDGGASVSANVNTTGCQNSHELSDGKLYLMEETPLRC
jgi:hypothetical protein